MPENPELAIGAVTADGYMLWSRQRFLSRLNANVRSAVLDQAQEKAQNLLAQLSSGCPQVSPQGAIAIVVDDGIATGMTMAVATQSLRAQNPAAIWICVPVAPPELMETLRHWADCTIVLETPDPFLSVSRFYADFPQVDTETALSYLQQHQSKI